MLECMTDPRDVPLPEREALVEACMTAALCRLRAWLGGEVVDLPDDVLVKEEVRPDVCVTVAKMRTDLAPKFCAGTGWNYELRRIGSCVAGDDVLWALVTSGVVEIAADSLTTLDPNEIVPYFATFFGHLGVHNLLQGVTAPHDTADLARFETDGEADHLARVITLLVYGKSPGVEPVDLDDPVVRRVMDGTAVPMFAVRSRRLGRSDAEHAARDFRRAWRGLGARLLRDGLPATSACVVPGDGLVHVKVGTWMRTYRRATPADAVVRAHADYADHLRDGNVDITRAYVEVVLDKIRRPW